MKPDTTRGVQRLGVWVIGAFAALVLGGWGSASEAQEGGGWAAERLQIPSARGVGFAEGPLAPAAFYAPLSELGSRSRVSVRVLGGWPGEAGEVEVVNDNPFTVQVYDITVLRQRGEGALEFRGERPVRLESGERAAVVMRRVGAGGEHRPRVLALRTHPVRFGLALPLDALEGVRRVAEGEAPGAAEATLLAGAMEEFLRVERASAQGPGYPSGELEAAQEELSGLAPQLKEGACGAEERLVLEALSDRAPRQQRTLELQRLGSMRELGAAGDHLTACFREGTWGLVVTAARAGEAPELLVWASSRFDQGVNTPEPFRGALIADAEGRLDRAERLLEAGAADIDWLIVQGLGAQVGALGELQALSPSHPRLESAGAALGERLVEELEAALEVRAFARSGMLLALLGREADRGAPGGRRRYESATALAAYREGQFFYHYRRGTAEDRARARALLEQGAGWAPLRSRLYLGGLAFVEHQFSAIFGLMGLVGLVGLGLRSRWLERLRGRVGLALARRRLGRGAPREALERSWGVLTRALGLEGDSPADQRLQALAAVGVLSAAEAAGELHEAQEARGLLARIAPALRPAGWQEPSGLLRRLEALVQGPLSGAELSAAQAQAAQVQALFPGTVEAHRAAALAAEAAVWGPASSAGERAVRYRAALHRWGELGPRDAGSRRRAGLLAAAWGPRCAASPEAGWSQAWGFLRERPGAEDGEAHRARAMAAALSEALEVLGGEDAALRAALHEAALRAPMPLEAGSQAALAQLAGLLEAGGGAGALEGRLRVAVLRRLGLQSEAASADEAYQRDLAGLMAQARQCAADEPRVRALAAALDLLTPGDLGFDRYAATAGGAEGALFVLLEALDHFGAGRGLEAAALLASAELSVGATPGQAARLDAARATVAESIGQRRAALEALRRACGALCSGQLDAAGALSVRRCAARLVRVALEAGDGVVLRVAAEGLLQEPQLAQQPVRWSGLGVTLARLGEVGAAEAALTRSEAEEGDAADAALRRAGWSQLVAAAITARDYARAARCAILAGGGASTGAGLA